MDCAPGGPSSQEEPACAGRSSDGNHARQRIAHVAVDLTVIDDQLALAEFPHDVHVVSTHNDRYPNILEPAEQPHDLQCEVRIEVAGGLVGNQQWRLAHNGARYAHALLFSD